MTEEKKSIIREPTQKRSIEKKEKIIDAGFELICDKGYYNTNTAQIAKVAGVSTGIVYQYFNDKHDILISGIKKNLNHIFFPMLKPLEKEFDINELDSVITKGIKKYIKEHRLSQTAHEEIMAMVHSDSEVEHIYYDFELEKTDYIAKSLVKNGFNPKNIREKVHIIINIIDDLCHELVYHKHSNMDYEEMTKITINMIKEILQ